MDFSKLSDRERLIAEQAVQTLGALDKAADDAPHGRGLACMEACIEEKGFGLLRADHDFDGRSPIGGAKKGACMRPCVCGAEAKFKACQSRTILTTVGHIAFARRRYHCRSCVAGTIPLDAWAGVGDRSISSGARRMVSLAGMSWSFDRASSHLKEFCHIDVSDDTIERVCQEEGERGKKWMNESSEPVAAFARAKGHAEFSSDGVKVNTVNDWREMRLSMLAKREPATTACRPQDWNDRVLNEPTARFSMCAIADADHVGASWKKLSVRMNLKGEGAINVMGDGAKWIWEQAAKRLPKHNGKWCVDVYHVSQHLHQCGRELLGEGPAARAWAQQRLMTALQANGPALIRRIESDASQETQGSTRRKALEDLLKYLLPNQDRMWYAQRLASGEPIGTGMIEGGCKNTIGTRLKLNNARWRIRRAERIGTLRCVDASNQWSNFWKSAA